MNLWVKRTGQLLLAALFMMACEDETYLLGFRDQKGKFNIGYVELEIGEGTVRADSVYTDNLTGTQRLLVGEYFDPEIGTVRTTAFTEFLPVNYSKIGTSTATLDYKYDSLVVQFRLDYYSYGLVNEGVSKFEIHRITEDTLTYRKTVIYDNNGTLDTAYLYNRYKATSTIGYDEGESLGEATPYTLTITPRDEIELKPTTLKLSKLTEAKDTIVVRCTMPEDSPFGNELFNIALNDPGSEYSDKNKFRSRFKGFALVPSESNAVIGLSLATQYSKVTMYYHTVVKETGLNKDTLTRDFTFTGASFHNIAASRSFGLPPMEEPYIGVDPGLKRVVESGAPLLTKISLDPFYEFIDTIDTDQKVLFNSAELVIESVPAQDGFAPIPNLELRVLKEDDSYFNRTVSEDSAAMSGYHVGVDFFGGYLGYFVSTDLTPSAAYLTYNKGRSRYSGFPTLFFQSLFDKRNKESSQRLRYLGLGPATSLTELPGISSVGKAVNRSVFDKQKVKLRIYYTYPNKPNL